MDNVSPGRVCARCVLWTTLSPSPWNVTWSPFTNLLFLCNSVSSFIRPNMCRMHGSNTVELVGKQRGGGGV